MSVRLSDVDLAIAVAECHDELAALFERLDDGQPISRHAVEDILETLRDISDRLFERGGP